MGSVRSLLEREGHRVLGAESTPAALVLLAAESVPLALLDLTNVEDLIRPIRERDSFAQIILRTRDGGEKPARELLRRLPIQGHHHETDGPERLLFSVTTALDSYDRLTQFHTADRLKTELLASVSHEFRTPLSVIVGYVDLVREGTFGACPPDALPVFDKVRANAGYLLELVEEFLDLSKLEAGITVVRCESLLLEPLLRELGEWFTLLVRARPITFVTDIPDGLPPVAAEPAKLRVVIQNLLSNAAKFTRQGTIGLAAVALDDGRVAVHVSDTGPGIGAEHHEAIFGLFHQLGPDEDQRKGVGLGLALARRFARMMGGDIILESTVGVGSTFTLVLPIGGTLGGNATG